MIIGIYNIGVRSVLVDDLNVFEHCYFLLGRPAAKKMLKIGAVPSVNLPLARPPTHAQLQRRKRAQQKLVKEKKKEEEGACAHFNLGANVEVEG